jgi:4-hydroxybenzoate polyprenyltransferase
MLPMWLSYLLRVMRPRQWTKNVFVFAAVVFDRKMFDFGHGYFWTTLLGFVLFCLLSSAVYIINDLVDIEKDRLHPVKRNRPLAAGVLPVPVAVAAVVVLLAIVIGASWMLNQPGGLELCQPCVEQNAALGALAGRKFALVVIGYLVLQLFYNFTLKQQVILDVLTIAAGFVLRVGAGVALIPVQRFSPWLYVCMTLLGLFIGFGKRRHELILLGAEATNHRANLSQYTLGLLDEMMGVVTASTVVAYSVYTFSAEGLPPSHLMMLTVPFVLYGIFRYLYLIHARGEGGAPEDVLLKDRPLQVDLVLWGLTVILIMYSETLARLAGLPG